MQGVSGVQTCTELLPSHQTCHPNSDIILLNQRFYTDAINSDSTHTSDTPEPTADSLGCSPKALSIVRKSAQELTLEDIMSVQEN